MSNLFLNIIIVKISKAVHSIQMKNTIFKVSAIADNNLALVRCILLVFYRF